MAKPQYTYRATVLRIIDADTLHLKVDAGFYISLEIRVRLSGIDAPELSTPEGKRARDYVKSVAPPGSDVVIETAKDPTDKYGRWLARLFIGNVAVNDDLIKRGLAKPYP